MPPTVLNITDRYSAKRLEAHRRHFPWGLRFFFFLGQIESNIVLPELQLLKRKQLNENLLILCSQRKSQRAALLIRILGTIYNGCRER